MALPYAPHELDIHPDRDRILATVDAERIQLTDDIKAAESERDEAETELKRYKDGVGDTHDRLKAEAEKALNELKDQLRNLLEDG